jgi:uncharacterized protein (UPF0216 family)
MIKHGLILLRVSRFLCSCHRRKALLRLIRHFPQDSIIRLSEEEMLKMNKTSLALKDGSGYIVELAAYHELHCVVSRFAIIKLSSF